MQLASSALESSFVTEHDAGVKLRFATATPWWLRWIAKLVIETRLLCSSPWLLDTIRPQVTHDNYGDLTILYDGRAINSATVTGLVSKVVPSAVLIEDEADYVAPAVDESGN